MLLARKSFRHFLKSSFPILRKSSDTFSDDWFYGEFGYHGEAFLSGQLTRLVVTTPPGTYKSRTFLVSLIAYGWLHNAAERFLCATNESELGIELSQDTRKLIRSAWYREGFKPEWEITDDQDAKKMFANTAGGHRQVTSVGAIVTGKKAGKILVDDLHDSANIRSITQRNSDKRWFYDALFDRMDNFKTSGILVVEHRLDKADLPGELIAHGWPELRLMERMDESRRKTFPLGGEDPRKHGEYLRPSRFGPVQEAEVKGKPFGEGQWNAKHQQDPRSIADSMFPSDSLPPYLSTWTVGLQCVRFWDTAASKTETASYSSGVLLGYSTRLIPTNEGIVSVKRWQIVHVKRGRWGWAERDDIIHRTAQEDAKRPGIDMNAIVIEHPGGSGGLQTWQILAAKLSGFPVFVQSTSGAGNKVHKAGPLSAQWKAKNVEIVDSESDPWDVKNFVERMETFPAYDEKDDTDAASGAFNWLASGNVGADVDPATGADVPLIRPRGQAEPTDFYAGPDAETFKTDFREERF